MGRCSRTHLSRWPSLAWHRGPAPDARQARHREEQAAARAQTRLRLWPLSGLVLLAVWALVVGHALDVGRLVRIAQAWTGSLGSGAPAVYILAYVGATLVGVPGTPFTLLAPFIFGTFTGFLIMVFASSVSATLAFLIARYVARNAVLERLAANAAFKRLSGLIEEHHWVLITIIRIVPIFPFAVVNYGLGLSRISFWQYALCSEIEMVLENAALVAGASLFSEAVLGAGSPGAPVPAAAAAAILVALGKWAGLRF
jgi:uncharacterized membrane protein YdjX (TVP38/TMEM64 family)